jgi:hypothetical protein
VTSKMAISMGGQLSRATGRRLPVRRALQKINEEAKRLSSLASNTVVLMLLSSFSRAAADELLL